MLRGREFVPYVRVGMRGLIAGFATGFIVIAPGCGGDPHGLFGASSNTQAASGSGGATTSGSMGAGGVGTSDNAASASGTGGSSSAMASSAGGMGSGGTGGMGSSGAGGMGSSGTGGGPGCTAAMKYDFESGDQGFTHAPTSGIPSDDPWARGTPAGVTCASGTNCWATNLDSAGYSNCQMAALVSPVIDLSACAASPQMITLSFEHYYQFEAPWMGRWYDGGLLQFSGDGGTTWADVTASQPYDGLIDGAYGNCSPVPDIGGHQGWSGGIPGGAWVQVTVDIPAMYRVSGFRIRWLFGTDEGVTERGWFIDDVALSAQ